MKRNICVAMPFGHDLQGNERMSLNYAVALSLIGHLIFLALFVATPGLHSEKPLTNSVINVSMVTLNSPAASATKKNAVENKAPRIEKPEVVKKPVVPSAIKKTASAVDKPFLKPKTALKKKTFHASRVVKQAIKQLEEKVDVQTDTKAEAASPESLKSALDRLRKAVDKTEGAKSAESGDGARGERGTIGGKVGRFNTEGKKAAERIELYRLEIAHQIEKSWAFNQQLAGGDHSLVAAIVFKVMPDGEIRDIFFTDRSGNTYLDESVYKAVVKSNPVDPHPQGLVQPYVVVAIRFSPEGIR